MTPELWVVILQFGIKFGIDSAIAVLRGIGAAKSIDDAIAALELAKTKTAQQYLDEVPSPLVSPTK